MPFDDTSSRGPFPGPDPAPTWGERAACWALLAALATAHVMTLALIVLWGMGGIALGIGGNFTGAVDCAGGALLTALVTYPFHLSWAKARALVAGRWF